ncbi:hypothetical protein SAMD00023353_4300690 [Rosellinia necatrix]|uniref:Uncharacterized protein n=1 Tax=Rosellinia necatrix TaxID=77044 RepID=A0A1W2TNT0_ROSNE|nr:hypothetical protein SAMD00023353_4300690 [Rosellinia necatrix]
MGKCGDKQWPYVVNGMCCKTGTTPVVLAGGTTVLCCPEGADCALIKPTACQLEYYNPRPNGADDPPSISTIFTRRGLDRCGALCCPWGYVCDDKIVGGTAPVCRMLDDQSRQPDGAPCTSIPTTSSIPVPSGPVPSIPQPSMPEPSMPEPSMPEPSMSTPSIPQTSTPEPSTSVDTATTITTIITTSAGAATTTESGSTPTSSAPGTGTETPSSSSGPQLGSGAIAGVVVGLFAVVGFVVIVVFRGRPAWPWKRRRPNSTHGSVHPDDYNDAAVLRVVGMTMSRPTVTEFIARSSGEQSHRNPRH